LVFTAFLLDVVKTGRQVHLSLGKALNEITSTFERLRLAITGDRLTRRPQRSRRWPLAEAINK